MDVVANKILAFRFHSEIVEMILAVMSSYATLNFGKLIFISSSFDIGFCNTSVIVVGQKLGV